MQIVIPLSFPIYLVGLHMFLPLLSKYVYCMLMNVVIEQTME